MKTIFISLFAIMIHGITKSQNDSSKVKIEVVNNDLFLKAYINGKGPYNFVFDTGASGIGRIDERIVKELNLKATDSTKNFDGSGKYKMVPVINIDTLKVGNVSLSNVQLLSRNYNAKIKDGETRTDGLIGRDFFANYLLSINVADSNLVYSVGELTRTENGVLSYDEPFKIRGKIGDRYYDFQIDSGSNMYMHFPKSIMDSLRHSETGKKGIARRANSEYFLHETILNETIELSLIKLLNPTLHYSKEAKIINVGMKFLKNYRITIDQKNKLIKLE